MPGGGKAYSILRIGPTLSSSDHSAAEQLKISLLQYFTTTTGDDTTTTTTNNNDETTGTATESSSSFTISNKYFSARILLKDTNINSTVVDDDDDNKDGSANTSGSGSYSEDGIVLVFQDDENIIKNGDGSFVSFDSLQNIHDQLIKNNTAGDLLRLCVGINFGTKRSYYGGGSEKLYEEEYSRRILWCLDYGYEYIEADISATGVTTGHDVRDKDGFARIVEAISGTVWSSAIMISSKKQQLHESYQIDKQVTTTTTTTKVDTITTKNSEPTSTTTTTTTTTTRNNAAIIIDDSPTTLTTDTTITHQRLETLDTDVVEINAQYLDDNESKIDIETIRQRKKELNEEHQIDAIEGAIRTARQIRELSLSGTLSDKERRQRASDAAVLLLNMMDLHGDSDDDDDNDNNNGNDDDE